MKGHWILAFALLPATFGAEAATYTVTTANQAGPGSLRQAMLDANQNPGPDTIVFDIAQVFTIALFTPLPVITGPVTIDGYTQPGAAPNTAADGTSNATPRIIVSGGLLADANGIELGDGSAGSVIRGLVINDFRNDTASTFGHGIVVSGSTNAGNSRIEGNFIGIGFTGLGARANAGAGVVVSAGGTGTIVGGDEPAERNVISGNAQGGVVVFADSTVVQGNLIGVQKDGVTALSNGADGVYSDAAGVAIGGDNAGNTIANSAFAGVVVCPYAQARITGNRIHSNGGLGIDLTPRPDCATRGPTLNDEGDADDGANGLQNAPEILLAARSAISMTAGVILVRGELQSRPSRVYRIDVFAAPVADARGYGQAHATLGAQTVVTDAHGYAYFTHTAGPRADVAVGWHVTATATDVTTNETSELANSLEVVNQLTVTGTANAGAGSLRQAILDANATPARDAIVFAIPGSGVQTILPVTNLPSITKPVVIDGYTQTGARPNSAATGTNAQLRVEIRDDAAFEPLDGIRLEAGAENSTIRGLVIGGLTATNGMGGGAIRSFNVPADNGHVVEGNFLGTTADGLAAARNDNSGVRFESLTYNHRIGSRARRDRNLISGNGIGVLVGGSSVVEGNLIGVAADGVTPLPNTSGGVIIAGSSVRVGGTLPASANVIAFNRFFGVAVASPDNVRNRIVGNSIHGNTAPAANTGLAIDLDASATRGVTPNDTDDADTGSNDLLNFPVLQSATAAGTLALQFTLDTPPSHVGAAYFIDVYSSTECDESGHGEGEHYLGSVLFPPQPLESYAVSVPVAPPAGDGFVAATTTDFLGNTSEFSACVPLAIAPQIFSDSFE